MINQVLVHTNMNKSLTCLLHHRLQYFSNFDFCWWQSWGHHMATGNALEARLRWGWLCHGSSPRSIEECLCHVAMLWDLWGDDFQYQWPVAELINNSDWWFGTWILLSHSVGNVIIPTDFHSIIFQRGRYTTNQLCELPHKYLKGSKSMAFPAFSQHVQTLSRGQEWGLICYKQAPSAPWAVKMKFQRERRNWYHRENINCIRWYWHVDFCQFSIFVGILSFHTIMQYTGCV